MKHQEFSRRVTKTGDKKWRLQLSERCEYEFAMDMINSERMAAARARLGNPTTFAEFFKKKYLPAMTDLARRMPANEGEVFLRQSLRYFEPWPDWALRIIVEIWRVYLPTIPRSTIYDFIRFAHDLFLVLKLDGSTPKEAFKCPEIDFVHVGALNGHMAALCENLMLRIKAEFEQNSISSEDYKRYADDLSPERMQTEMLPFLRALPSKLFAFAEGFAQAKSDTFDKKGSLRETMLTKVYVEIFENWPAIEELSGPTALCAFLNPVLKGNITDSEMQLDRVKKICQRMGIRFKPLKKG